MNLYTPMLSGMLMATCQNLIESGGVYYMYCMQSESLIQKEGYTKCMWYWNLIFSFVRGLRPLNCDVGVLEFIEDINAIGIELVGVYVEHSVDNHDIINETKLGNGIDE